MTSGASQSAHNGWQKICRAISPWPLFNNTTFLCSRQTNSKIYFETWDCDLWRPMASGASQTAYGGQHKSATPFYHGYYLTTLLSCAQVRQYQNLYFETRDFDL